MPSHNHAHSSKPKSSSVSKKSSRCSTAKKHSTPTTSHSKNSIPVNGSNSSAHQQQYTENHGSHTNSQPTNSYVSSDGTALDPNVQQWLAQDSESAASRNYQYGVSNHAGEVQQTDGELSLDEFGPPPHEDPWFVEYGYDVPDPEGNFAGIGAQFES